MSGMSGLKWFFEKVSSYIQEANVETLDSDWLRTT